MSRITRPPIATAKTETAPPAAAWAPDTTVLVTEKQVAFATAAAAWSQPHRRTWSRTALIARFGRMMARLTETRPYPIRAESSFFEAARMSREMERL